jgi:NitT/TauT family transport system substrate-binding protein
MNGNKTRTSRGLLFPLAMVLAACVGMISSGCSRGKDSSAQGPAKITICYLGLTCEPAIFVAFEKGFFKDEGVDVELVKSDWTAMRDGLAEGRFHASYSFIMYLIKPMPPSPPFPIRPRGPRPIGTPS